MPVASEAQNHLCYNDRNRDSLATLGLIIETYDELAGRGEHN